MRLSVVNLKGGTGKTTSAVFLAASLSERGKTLLVDADPQQSALSWSATAEEAGEGFEFTVAGLAVRDVHKQLKKLAADYDHVVIDTPPGEIPIVRSALMGSDAAVLALAPGAMDLDRMRPTLELVAEIEPLNDLSCYVLLTRVMRITREGINARAAMEQLELPVLKAEVPRLQFYSEAFGWPVDQTADYQEVLRELIEEEAEKV